MAVNQFNPEDIVGKQFGRLTVKEYLGKKPQGKRSAHIYRCLCECGNETEAERQKLLQGRKKSCGNCPKNQTFIATTTEFHPAPQTVKPESQDYPLDLLGVRFGRLVVTGYQGIKAKGYYKPLLYECKCDCGNTVIISRNSLLNGMAKSCGCMANERKRRKA